MLFLRVCHSQRDGTVDGFQPWLYEVLQEMEGLGEERPVLAGLGWGE